MGFDLHLFILDDSLIYINVFVYYMIHVVSTLEEANASIQMPYGFVLSMLVPWLIIEEIILKLHMLKHDVMFMLF